MRILEHGHFLNDPCPLKLQVVVSNDSSPEAVDIYTCMIIIFNGSSPLSLWDVIIIPFTTSYVSEGCLSVHCTLLDSHILYGLVLLDFKDTNPYTNPFLSTC